LSNRDGVIGDGVHNDRRITGRQLVQRHGPQCILGRPSVETFEKTRFVDQPLCTSSTHDVIVGLIDLLAMSQMQRHVICSCYPWLVRGADAPN
jgi:hypothetical protein